jgi:Probable zinc-ribbon domain
MFLMPGKPPYSHAGGTDPAQNVRKRHFPYNLGEKRGVDVPAGPWRFIWSHFPYRVKQKFQAVFAGQDRPDIAEWLKILDCYRYDLDAGHVSAEIFPTSFKQLTEEQTAAKGGKWLKCYVHEGFYSEFRDLNEYVTPICPECRKKVWKRITCSEPGRSPHEFTITHGERVYYASMGLQLPKRCKQCRDERRQRSDY